MATKAPPTKKYLGQNIHDARTNLQKTQLQLAHAIGLKGDDAGAYISRVEAGQQEPRLHTLMRIAKALKVPLEDLLANPKAEKK